MPDCGEIHDEHIAACEGEHRRLARLLEVRLGQSLNLLLAQANTYHIVLSSSDTRSRKATRTLVAMADSALTDLRDVVADLNPTDLHDLGLDAALEALSLRIERRYGLVVTLDLAGGSIPSHLVLATYRIAQEALHNAGQHAGAGRVGLSLRLEQGGLRLTVADDGDGFQPPEPLKALAAAEARSGDRYQRGGLAEMVEQAEAVGGRLEISSVLGVGTQVRAICRWNRRGAARKPALAGGRGWVNHWSSRSPPASGRCCLESLPG
ncbi:MAG: hypothetical protein SXV54_09050 [Chloroflexota bacterium]|nr:hypothetical protein [Chloroflexota bacterium]